MSTKKIFQTINLSIFAGVLLALVNCGSVPMNTSIKAKEKRVSDYLDRLVAKDKFPGIQYIVVDANSVRLNYVGGLRDVATGEKVNTGTTFLSASTTKVLTAAAILKLMEAGKVKLDDSLSKYFPEHPYGPELKIRHLLNQSSGVPNPMPIGWLHTSAEHKTHSENEALAEALANNPELDFPPGQKYAYSNLSYWLLGKVVEQASGMSYCAYMRSHVFAPLSISPAELDCEIPDEKNHARGHQGRYAFMTLLFRMLTDSKLWDDSARGWARYQFLYMHGPAYGGLFGTAMGYAKFLQDMLREKPLLFSAATRDLFFQEQKDADGRLMPTTPGWHRGQNGSETYYGKPGGGPGYNSNIRVYRKAGIATVYLSNMTRVSEGPINSFSNTLDAEFLGQ